ncbi:hypothetical protein ABT150_46640 [Streptomyces mirabilis]|uniref:hypothetical protein n=1 Tax=Streptomyces mirabilis TaxID=68239 RepID=UPI00332BAF32
MGPSIRLPTLADVIGHLGESRQSAIVDATEIRVRRPAQGTDGRDCYVSGKSRQNAVKVPVLTDANGRLLFDGALKPGIDPNITQARDAGLVKLLGRHHDLRSWLTPKAPAFSRFVWFETSAPGRCIRCSRWPHR